MDGIPSGDLAEEVAASCCNPGGGVVDVQRKGMKPMEEQESLLDIWPSPCPSTWWDPSGAGRNSCTTLADCCVGWFKWVSIIIPIQTRRVSNLHFWVGQDHDVNLGRFNVVAVVANDPGQSHFADLLQLFFLFSNGSQERRKSETNWCNAINMLRKWTDREWTSWAG